MRLLGRSFHPKELLSQDRQQSSLFFGLVLPNDVSVSSTHTKVWEPVFVNEPLKRLMNPLSASRNKVIKSIQKEPRIFVADTIPNGVFPQAFMFRP